MGRAFVASLQVFNGFLSRRTHLKITFFVLVGTLFDSTTIKMYFPFTSQEYFCYSIKWCIIALNSRNLNYHICMEN